jgi:hypothetical protein
MYTINGITYLSTTEAAQLLNRHPGTLRNQRLHQRETVRSVTIGTSVLYSETEVRRAARLEPLGAIQDVTA